MFFIFSKQWLERIEERSINRERRKHKSQTFWGGIHIKAEGIILSREEQSRILNDLKTHYLKG